MKYSYRFDCRVSKRNFHKADALVCAVDFLLIVYAQKVQLMLGALRNVFIVLTKVEASLHVFMHLSKVQLNPFYAS